MEIILEGTFGARFGPRFDLADKGGGPPLGFLLWLFSRRKKKKRSIDDILQLLRTLPVLDALRLISSED